MDSNYYNVLEWGAGNPCDDIGAVINSIIADIKSRQSGQDVRGGKPGAVIYLPPGDYHLRTQVVIDVSYLKIMGAGHGFTSSSIRFNTPESELAGWHELWPGGSRILVDIRQKAGEEEARGAAFYVARSGNPRISSVHFADFCIDGLHFDGGGPAAADPENSYVNGKTGIYVASPQDSFRVTGMGLVYLEHGITVYGADALSIHDNFIAECGSCIEMRGWGQASKITDNLIGAGYKGYSIYAQNMGGLLIAANNVFPRGASCVHFSGVTRSSITGNRFHSFYPGMLVFEDNSSDNLASANHFYRDREPWPPMQTYNNGLDDLYGLLYIRGNNNSVIGNHISETIDARFILPPGAAPVIIHIVSGQGNYISSNHIIASTNASAAGGDDAGSCYSMQVDALLDTGKKEALEVTAVLVEGESSRNVVLDSGSESQVVLDKAANSFRATPAVPA